MDDLRGGVRPRRDDEVSQEFFHRAAQEWDSMSITERVSTLPDEAWVVFLVEMVDRAKKANDEPARAWLRWLRRYLDREYRLAWEIDRVEAIAEEEN